MGIAHQADSRIIGKTTDSWITPKWLIDRLGPFDLDPCASNPQPWPTAARMLTEKDNGLLSKWEGLVWCNPPYGRALDAWLSKCALHGNTIALVFARTETKTFHSHVWPIASGILFLKGRLRFHRPDGSSAGNAGGPSVLIAYGEQALERLKAASELGMLIELRRKEAP